MARILVATDGSESADRAVDFAAQAAKRESADLIIVNIIGGFGLPENLFERISDPQQTWLREALRGASARLLTRARDRARGIGLSMIQLESREGDVAFTIIDIAQEKAVESIVVGKRGSGQLTGLLLGSVSQKLVSLAPVPVTVIP